MILLDANVLLEMLIAGRPRKDQILTWFVKNRQEFIISMLTVHLVLHFGLRDGLTVGDLKNFLADYPKAALLPEDYAAAVEILQGQDHEDALQLAVAERLGCSYVVTLDEAFAKTYKNRIRFINPATV